MRVYDKIDRLSKFLNVGKKMQDSIPIGFLGGLMGTIAMDFSNMIFKKTGLSEKTYSQYAGSVLLSPFRQVFKQNMLFGQMLHLMTGSILGIPMFNILKKTGKDNHQFKGVVYGIVTWEMIYSFGQRLGIIRAKTYTVRSHITSLIDHLVYGFVSTMTMVFLADHSVFPKASNQQSEIPSERQMPKQHDMPKDDSTYANEMNINPD